MRKFSNEKATVGFAAKVRLQFPELSAWALCVVCLFAFAIAPTAQAQLAPGPYEILPFDDGCIIEGFKDLDTRANYLADWTGYSYVKGSGWYLESPHCYDAHSGTDFSMQTGTPLRAAASGTVTALVNTYARNQIDNTSGNYVRIAVDAVSPNGESLDLTYCHMLTVSVTVGQHVTAGQVVGTSDNNGQSDSEHLHFMTALRGGNSVCPFHWAHFKYPIMLNPTGTMQVGRVIRVTATNTAVRAERFDTSTQIATAWQNQLFFSAFPKRGYYHVFIPNNASLRHGFIRATDAEEVFTGTVIQPLPDNGTYLPGTQLTSKYSIRSLPSDDAGQIGLIYFGGTRFVADQVSGDYYRIPLPGTSATWGWVKPNNRMVVYGQLTNPSFNLALLPNNEFPIRERFATVTNTCMFGRPKFNRSIVKAFTPSAPSDGDGKVLFVTDATNGGTGTSESVTVGKPGHRNYYVQSDMYFAYEPSYLVGSDYERYGIFLRDDCFAGLDTTYEGAGNCYALTWDSDDGRFRAGKLMDGTWTDFFSTAQYIQASGWHTLRIEARENEIKYFLDGNLLLTATDTTFPCGTCGVAYSWHTYSSSYPGTRGACFDNLIADTLDLIPPKFLDVNLQPDGRVHMWLTGNIGSTVAVDRTLTLTNWAFLTNLVHTNRLTEFSDDTNATSRFYRARRLQ